MPVKDQRDNDEALDLLFQLRQARERLTAAQERYDFHLQGTVALRPVSLLVLVFVGLASFAGCIYVWFAPIADHNRAPRSVSLLFIGLFCVAVGALESARNSRLRALRLRLKAELAIARDIERTLAAAERDLEAALGDEGSE